MAKKVVNISKYRVVSDGTITGTVVYDGKGNKVGRVRSLRWEASVDNAIPTLYLEIIGAEIDAKGIPYITRRVDRTVD